MQILIAPFTVRKDISLLHLHRDTPLKIRLSKIILKELEKQLFASAFPSVRDNFFAVPTAFDIFMTEITDRSERQAINAEYMYIPLRAAVESIRVLQKNSIFFQLLPPQMEKI